MRVDGEDEGRGRKEKEEVKRKEEGERGGGEEKTESRRRPRGDRKEGYRGEEEEEEEEERQRRILSLHKASSTSSLRVGFRLLTMIGDELRSGLGGVKKLPPVPHKAPDQ